LDEEKTKHVDLTPPSSSFASLLRLVKDTAQFLEAGERHSTVIHLPEKSVIDMI
jgi:hypothetical protein